jgi:hypothetical protein
MELIKFTKIKTKAKADGLEVSKDFRDYFNEEVSKLYTRCVTDVYNKKKKTLSKQNMNNYEFIQTKIETKEVLKNEN